MWKPAAACSCLSPTRCLLLSLCSLGHIWSHLATGPNFSNIGKLLPKQEQKQAIWSEEDIQSDQMNQNSAQRHQNGTKRVAKASKMELKRHQNHQNGAPRPPKASKVEPKGYESHQNGAPRPPKATKMEPKVSQEDPKMIPCRNLIALGSISEAILELSWSKILQKTHQNSMQKSMPKK